MVVWLRQDRQGIAVEDGIIRRADWLHIGALDAAFRSIDDMRRAVLLRAEEEAQCIVAAAHAHAQQVLQTAEQAGETLLENSRDSGLQSGIDAWNNRLLKATLESHEQLRQQRERMARIVIAAVEKIVPLQDPQGIYRQVLRMLSKSMQAVRYVTVRVCPGEVGFAETALREIADGSAIGKLIEVIADERLVQGACLVESDQGIIDLSLNSQLKALRAAISLSVGGPPAPSAVPTAGSRND